MLMTLPLLFWAIAAGLLISAAIMLGGNLPKQKRLGSYKTAFTFWKWVVLLNIYRVKE